MKAAWKILFVVLVAGCGYQLGCAIDDWLMGGPPAKWSVEVLRTSDARGMTYSSLHNARGEPFVSGSSLRWTDEHGQRWIQVNGAVAHEMKEDVGP